MSKKNYDNNIELIIKAQGGDEEALSKVVEQNMPLVTALSKKFLNRGYEYDDIFQIGSIGLIKAINNFNTDYNVKFSTYAVPMILGEIKRFIRDDGYIKVSRSIKYTAKKIHFEKEKLEKKLCREPRIEELAEFMGIDKEEILFAQEAVTTPEYLYETIHQDDGAPIYLMDKIKSEEDVFSVIDKIALKDALATLDKRSRQIVILRYIKDITQVQVAKMLGISQVQVSRIEKRVLKMIRKSMEE